jgi:hypothetical protein
MVEKADLHVRTTATTGKYTPIDVVAIARQKKLRAIAVVEHETLSGATEALRIAPAYGVEVIPGVELVYESGERNCHLIGYFVDPHNERLRREIGRAQGVRLARINEIISKLSALGLDVRYEELLHEVGGAEVLTRVHIAQYLVKTGQAQSVPEVFRKYLAPGKPAHVEREDYPLPVLLDFIQQAGGVPALAHPKFGGAEQFLPELVREGLKAIEVYHPTHTAQDIKRFRRLAKRYKLIEVGGTDSGSAGVGEVCVPYSVVKKLEKCRKR